MARIGLDESEAVSTIEGITDLPKREIATVVKSAFRTVLKN
jgi:hypothetical protein